MNTKYRMGFTLLAFAMLLRVEVRGGEAPLPDLTKGTGGIDRSLTYNLGATGMRGWIYTPHWPQNIDRLDSMQGRTTGSSRQILVTHVGAKSPADGVMMVDDVILGAGGKPFSDDSRKSLAVAIQEAEKESNGGVLKLTRWRKGQTEEVRLKLRVMGTYADTAPYACQKSKRIFDEACQALEQEPLNENWCGAINGLALLATGKAEYLPRVREFARKMAPSTLKLESKPGMMTWDWGYRNLFLCEYYLLTKDPEVFHAINEYTISLAKGQGMYGTFGHGISDLTAEGGFHGSIPPYGPVNMCGLSANISIILGKRCGVKDPEVDAAVVRASGFFGYYVDKGTIPYGEHEPWYFHENNGKSALSAVLFGLQPDRIKETRYWARMCVAAYPNTEVGHTGQGFSYLWRMVGADIGGPLAAAAFFKEMSWHFDLVRRCDGTFTYDGGEQYGPGKTDDNTYYGKSSYYGLSPNATYVLTYSIPLKKLCITGRDMNPATVGNETKDPAWLTKQEVDDAIAAGRFDRDRKQKSIQELTGALGNWSPIVRIWAAEELAKRPEAKALVPQWITAAEGSNARLRLGACEALHQIKAQEALPVFVRLLHHEDRGLRFLAARAIKDLGGAAQPALNDILTAFVDTAEPLVPVNFADPIQFAHGQLIPALFSGGLADALKQADSKMVLKAARVASKNADNRARGYLEGFINRLTADEVKTLLPDIVELAVSQGPADTMFRREIRVSAFKVLAKYHFQEGIKAAPLVAKGKYGCHNAVEIMAALETYGSAAQEIIPDLKQLIVDYRELLKEWQFPATTIPAVEHAIKVIEAAKDHPPLLSAGATPPPAKEPKQGIMRVAGAGTLAAQSAIQIVPLPRVVRPAAGTFALTPQTLILVNSPDVAAVGRYLSEMLAPATGLKLAVRPPPNPASRNIVLALDKGRADLGQEGYALNCTPEALTITAATPAGVFYGVQTLRQLLPIQIESRQPVQGIAWQVPCVAIDDQPRFKWRGYLIDPARNFRTKEELKRYIDLLALHKLNILQLHLTDDQGWRIEIKRYPKLVETGARLPDYGGKTGDGWFYSQADIRELVRYAADRYVTLVPEIEMPGHSGAAIASYPELACGGKPPGGWSAPLCVSQETTFEFAANVLDEVIALFPSPFIHIGADEVPPGSWRACAKCKPLMDKLVGTPPPADVTSCRVRVASGQGLPFHEDIGRLQGEFVRRLDQHLTTKGRRMVGWDEILEGGLKIGSHAVVMAWRGASAVAGTTGRNQDVVVSLHPDYYLDNDTPLQRTYDYEPVPDDLPAAQAKRVLGVQGNMWGETTSSLQKVDARTFPRLCALAETGWTGRDGRDFADFSARLTDLRQRLELLGVAGGKP